MHRFYHPTPDFMEPRFQLSAEESHHCKKVLRLQPGQRIAVFDGSGNEACGLIESVGDRVGVGVVSRHSAPAARCSITLAQAVPKGKNMDLIVQKAVELGATRIVPLLSERTVVAGEADDFARKREKWQSVAVEACKQCGQNRLPEIVEPVRAGDFCRAAPTCELALVASLQPGAKPIKAALAEFNSTRGRRPESAMVLVGPEGDFTPAETGLAISNGYVPVTLGPIILRTETAAIYCLSVLGHELF